MPKESLCIKVSKTHAEKTIALTNKFKINNKELEIQKNTQFVYIPLTHEPLEKELSTLKTQMPDLQIETHTFPEKKPQKKTLIDVLENQLPPHLLASLPRALDTIGDIAIIEIPPELNTHAKLIGEAILKTHKNKRTVLAKAGAVTGTYRLRELSIIAGEPRTTTIHKEHGCKYHVDTAKAYFSPRLSNEHNRVASLVQTGETVIDLFAGVGPFAVLIAKTN
jgi:tRNA (guanine37-N1)-methyltransferase